MLKHKTDEKIILLVQEDSEYFGEIIDRYEKKLFRYISRIANFSHDERDDILQEVFIAVYKNIFDFEDGQKFSSWIYQIAHNKTIDYWRKNKKDRGQDISVDENLDFVNSVFWKNDVDEEIQNIENQELLKKLFSILDLKYREIFILRYEEEKKYEEISEILKIPKSTVSTLLNRGRKKIIEEYQKIIEK